MTSRFAELVRHEVMLSLRSKRLVVMLVLYMGTALLGGLALSAAYAVAERSLIQASAGPLGVSEQEMRAQLAAPASAALHNALETFGVDLDTIAPALSDSAVAAVFFWCSLVCLPFLIAMVTFDSVASPLNRRSLCYETLRASRRNIVLARLLSHTLIVSVVTALSAAAVLGIASRLLPSLPLGGALRSAAWTSTLLVPHIAIYVALCVLCSASTPKANAALVRAVGAIIVLWALTLPERAVGFAIDEDSIYAYLRWLNVFSPNHYRLGLWKLPTAGLLKSLLAYAAFWTSFSALAVFSLQRRDL